MFWDGNEVDHTFKLLQLQVLLYKLKENLSSEFRTSRDKLPLVDSTVSKIDRALEEILNLNFCSKKLESIIDEIRPLLQLFTTENDTEEPHHDSIIKSLEEIESSTNPKEEKPSSQSSSLSLNSPKVIPSEEEIKKFIKTIEQQLDTVKQLGTSSEDLGSFSNTIEGALIKSQFERGKKELEQFYNLVDNELDDRDLSPDTLMGICIGAVLTQTPPFRYPPSLGILLVNCYSKRKALLNQGK